MENLATKEQILIEGSKKFRQIVDSPSEALNMLLDALHYIHSYYSKKEFILNESPFYTFELIIKYVIAPWFLNDEAGVVRGFEEIYKDAGNNIIQTDIVKYLVASINEWESPCESDLTCVNAIASLGQTMDKYYLFKEAELRDKKAA